MNLCVLADDEVYVILVDSATNVVIDFKRGISGVRNLEERRLVQTHSRGDGAERLSGDRMAVKVPSGHVALQSLQVVDRYRNRHLLPAQFLILLLFPFGLYDINERFVGLTPTVAATEPLSQSFRGCDFCDKKFARDIQPGLGCGCCDEDMLAVWV